MKFYKDMSVLKLLYGSESQLTGKRDEQGIQAAEMRLLRSIEGYSRQYEINSKALC